MQEIEEIKKSKIVGGLSGEAKQLVDKFSRTAKEKGKPFTDFESEGLLYVTVYDENNLVYYIKKIQWKEKRNRKRLLRKSIEDINRNPRLEVTDRVIFMQKLFIKLAKENSKI